jgi:hypothetical protein
MEWRSRLEQQGQNGRKLVVKMITLNEIKHMFSAFDRF